MIVANRSRLLQLRQKQTTLIAGLAILKARRQALVSEYLASSRDLLRFRQRIGRSYRQGLAELAAARRSEGRQTVQSVAAAAARVVSVEVGQARVLGVGYSTLCGDRSLVRELDERPYDYGVSCCLLERAAGRFEKLAEELLELAGFEDKLKKLGAALVQVTRKSRIVEERLLPGLAADIRSVAIALAEREREERFQRKRFKDRAIGWRSDRG